MLVILVSFAFGFGLLLTRIGLPPMVGFLVAGFAYNMAGLTPPQGLDFVADLGITLLLFSIGLKLDVRGLLKAEIWASSTVQMIVTTAFMYLMLLLGQHLFPSPLMDMSWQAMLVLAFALSFRARSSRSRCWRKKGI